jgi:hypothetical protein
MSILRPAALLLLTACYRYVPSTRDALAPGAEVRVSLTPAGTSQLVPVLGNQTTAVEGRVLNATDTSYVLALSGTLKSLGGNGSSSVSRTVWAGDSVAIPGAAVGGVERRLLDSKRTTLLAIVGTAAATATVRVLVHAFGGKSSSGGDGGGVIMP